MEIPRYTWAAFDAQRIGMPTPAIIADAAAQGESTRKWTPDYLKSIAPDRLVVLSTAPLGRFSHDENATSPGTTYRATHMSMSEATELIIKNDGPQGRYVMQHPAAATAPEMLSDVIVPSWLRNTAIANVWFGSKTVTPLHFDYMDNFFLQVYGEKEFLLFPPSDTKKLYPQPRSSPMSHASRLDPENVDPLKFPAYSDSNPVKVRVMAGEILYLPSFWWHQVRSNNVSISISYWVDCTLDQFLSAPNSTRALSRMYSVDGLREFEKAWLGPQGLDFMAVAIRLTQQNRWVDALPMIQAHLDRRLEAPTNERGESMNIGREPPRLGDLRQEARALSTICDSECDPVDVTDDQFSSRIRVLIRALHAE